MNIKCSKHPDCDATFVCEQCGFICGKDTKDANTEKHLHIQVSKAITDLYEAISKQKKVQQQSFFINQLKEFIDDYLAKEDKENQAKATLANAEVKKCLSEVQGISAQALKEIVEQNVQSKAKKVQNDIEKEKKVIIQMLSQIFGTQELSEKNEKKEEIGKICKVLTIEKINILNLQKDGKIEQVQDLQSIPKKEEQIKKEENNVGATQSKALVKYTENEWKNLYDQIAQKYGNTNSKIQCAAKILENKTKKEGKNIIENFAQKILSDDGAIAIGYAIRKNNTLQKVSISSDKPGQQQHRRHWSTRICHGTHRQCHTHQGMSTHHEIYLYNNNISDDGAISIANMLSINKKLQYLCTHIT